MCPKIQYLRGSPSESYSLVRGAEIFQMIKDELHQTPIISLILGCKIVTMVYGGMVEPFPPMSLTYLLLTIILCLKGGVLGICGGVVEGGA